MMRQMLRDYVGQRLLCTLAVILLMQLTLVLLSGCSPTIKYLCPPLAPVPTKALDALEATGRKDPSTGAWVVQLDKHYQKLDACSP